METPLARIRSFEEFTQYIETWANFGGSTPPYDFVGMALLFQACLKNMGRCATDPELDELPDILDEDAQRVLQEIVSRLKGS